MCPAQLVFVAKSGGKRCGSNPGTMTVWPRLLMGKSSVTPWSRASTSICQMFRFMFFLFLAIRFWRAPFSRKPRACPLREQKVAIPVRLQMRLFTACSWAIADRGKDPQHPDRASSDGVFDMHVRVGNNVRNSGDQEKDPRSYTHQKQQDAPPENGLLLHEQRAPLLT